MVFSRSIFVPGFRVFCRTSLGAATQTFDDHTHRADGLRGRADWLRGPVRLAPRAVRLAPETIDIADACRIIDRRILRCFTGGRPRNWKGKRAGAYK
jgi:hypothetical protein